MTGTLRFEGLIVPDQPRKTVLARFRSIETPGFDLRGLADHFVDRTDSRRPRFALRATLGVMELGMTGIGLYRPTLPAQWPMFERIATEAIPKPRAAPASSRTGPA